MLSIVIIYIEYFTHSWIKIKKKYLLDEFINKFVLLEKHNNIEICSHCGLIRERYRAFENVTYTDIGYLDNYKRILRRYERLINRIDEKNKEIKKRKKMKIRETNYNQKEIFNKEFFDEMGITFTGELDI